MVDKLETHTSKAGLAPLPALSFGVKRVLMATLTATVLATATLVGGCAVVEGRQTAGEYVDDTTITTSVKAAILDDPYLKTMQISVETMQNVVQLSGFVDSQFVRLRAGDVARGISGVRSVRNNLVVR